MWSTLLGGLRSAATCRSAGPHSGGREIHSKDGLADPFQKALLELTLTRTDLWLLAEAFASSPLLKDDPEPQLLRDMYDSVSGLGGAALLWLGQACGPTVTVPTVSVGLAP